MEEPGHPVASPSPEGSEDNTARRGSPEAYSPPLAPDAIDYTPHSVRAGFWLRFVAFTIDTVVLGGFSLLLLSVGLIITSLDDYAGGTGADTEEFFLLFPLWIAGMLTAAAAYFTILHSEHGQTIGKSLLGLEVRMRDGALPSYSQAHFRWLARPARWHCRSDAESPRTLSEELYALRLHHGPHPKCPH